MKKVFVIIVISYLTLIIPLHVVSAQQMTSPEYKIESFDSVEVSPQNTDLEEEKKVDNSEFETQGYIIKTTTKTPLSLHISKTNLSMEQLNEQESIAETTINISHDSVFSYQISAAKESELQTANGNKIENTGCNSTSPCNIKLAQPWSDSDAYGFGYNLTGQDIAQDFVDETYYRPFPDEKNPQLLQSSQNTVQFRTSTLKFKINTPKSQPEGSYETIIDIFAIARI